MLNGGFELTTRITRETNNEVAQVCHEYSSRFGFFGSLPLPDVEGSLEEIDSPWSLGGSELAVMTNAQGYYLGDSRFDPAFMKLNEYKTFIFLHPIQRRSLDSPEADKALAQYPTPATEFFFDTTRAVANLLQSGTVTRFENITFLVSHRSATLPPLVERLAFFSPRMLKSGEK